MDIHNNGHLTPRDRATIVAHGPVYARPARLAVSPFAPFTLLQNGESLDPPIRNRRGAAIRSVAALVHAGKPAHTLAQLQVVALRRRLDHGTHRGIHGRQPPGPSGCRHRLLRRAERHRAPRTDRKWRLLPAPPLFARARRDFGLKRHFTRPISFLQPYGPEIGCHHCQWILQPNADFGLSSGSDLSNYLICRYFSLLAQLLLQLKRRHSACSRNSRRLKGSVR